ncbi:fluoride efflux transporter CrcB [Pontixanthobacter aestiaquae]|uniref:Fluoride-specific ion channel FluC n=1 Tax=Pontixanthobacter aestiaquae TaxID=1509367 RepID=A0A844Z6N4_9SPHN|nr:fluoride efflux transporter CrcB [Pontixanthobacter aestiaquae]MDN3646102.1 fluoride efflux transporter CrcB [Pontixanthobacter aestiaquae]MXO82906.1 fluoride efflux transporter CrcB [Pontixanthobacter aestiaquae]
MSSLSPLVATLNVAVGGAAGAALRYQTGRAVTGWVGPKAASTFPWATLTVNLVGCLLMGALAGWLARHGGANSEQWRLLLGVGLLGGFTTFSAFSLEMMLLIERGQIGQSLLYAFVSVMAGLVGLYIGLYAVRLVS